MLSVHVLQNPVKVIKIEGNLNDSNSWRKPFSKLNGNIFQGFWLIALKSFSYEIKIASQQKILKVHCNIVKGFEHEQNSAQPEKHCNPSISEIELKSETMGFKLKYFEAPTYFLINNVSDMLEINFSYFPKEKPVIPFIPPKDIQFEAVFHYFCQSN
jgi:hypothetical protein